MAKQLKECLIVHAVSIFTKRRKVNDLGSGPALWIEKTTDWILILSRLVREELQTEAENPKLEEALKLLEKMTQ